MKCIGLLEMSVRLTGLLAISIETEESGFLPGRLQVPIELKTFDAATVTDLSHSHSRDYVKGVLAEGDCQRSWQQESQCCEVVFIHCPGHLWRRPKKLQEMGKGRMFADKRFSSRQL